MSASFHIPDENQAVLYGIVFESEHQLTRTSVSSVVILWLDVEASEAVMHEEVGSSYRTNDGDVIPRWIPSPWSV